MTLLKTGKDRTPSNIGSIDSIALALTGADKREVNEIVQGVHRIVLSSFENDVVIPGTLDPDGNPALAKPSQGAYRLRATMCMGLVARCRNDYKWSLRRTMENLPEALRRVLGGEDWDPGPKTAIDGVGSGRISWSPGGVAKFADPLGTMPR